MNSYKNISDELRSCIVKTSFLKPLLNMDVVFIFAGGLILILNALTGFGSGFGELIHTLGYWGFLLGLLLAFANFNISYVWMGTFGLAAIKAFVFIKSIFGSFSFMPLAQAIVYAFLGYVIYKHASNNNADIAK